jgi:hypothetical protein
VIRSYLKKEGKSVSDAYLSKIKNQKENDTNKVNTRKPRGPPPKLINDKIKKLQKMVEKPDPPTQRERDSKSIRCQPTYNWSKYQKIEHEISEEAKRSCFNFFNNS